MMTFDVDYKTQRMWRLASMAAKQKDGIHEFTRGQVNWSSRMVCMFLNLE